MDKIAMASPQGSQSQQLRLELHFSSGPWAVFDSAICQAQQQHQVHSSNIGQKTANQPYFFHSVFPASIGDLLCL